MHCTHMYVGHRLDDFHDSIFIRSCFQSTNDVQTCMFITQQSLTGNLYIIILQMFRTTYHNADLPYLDAGNVNVGRRQSVVKYNSSCSILVTRAIRRNCSEFVVQRQKLFESFLGKWENPFFLSLFLKDAVLFIWCDKIIKNVVFKSFADSS